MIVFRRVSSRGVRIGGSQKGWAYDGGNPNSPSSASYCLPERVWLWLLSDIDADLLWPENVQEPSSVWNGELPRSWFTSYKNAKGESKEFKNK